MTKITPWDVFRLMTILGSMIILVAYIMGHPTDQALGAFGVWLIFVGGFWLLVGPNGVIESNNSGDYESDL